MSGSDGWRKKRFRGAVVIYLGAFLWINVVLLLVMDLIGRVTWTPALRTFVAVWLVFYVGTVVLRHARDAARDWSEDARDGPQLEEPLAFLRGRARTLAIDATDVSGRWTVVALIWATLYFVIDSQVLSERTGLDLSRLIDEYVNVALLVGPVGGLVWWCAVSEYRRTLRERGVAARPDATIDVVSTVLVAAIASAVVVLTLDLA
jgi:hypothetical protein